MTGEEYLKLLGELLDVHKKILLMEYSNDSERLQLCAQFQGILMSLNGVAQDLNALEGWNQSQ